MKVIITATAPTVYQYGALNTLIGRQPERRMNGSFTASREFNSVIEARQWIKDRAAYLYECEPQQLRSNTGKNFIHYDGITASIEKLNS